MVFEHISKDAFLLLEFGSEAIDRSSGSLLSSPVCGENYANATTASELLQVRIFVCSMSYYWLLKVFTVDSEIIDVTCLFRSHSLALPGCHGRRY